MTNRSKIIIVLLLLIAFSVNAFSASAGTTLFNFLKLSRNAVQAALAGMTIFGEKQSFTNPAVLGFLDKYNITGSYAAHFQNTNYNSFTFAVPVKDVGWSISYFGLDYGKMDGYTEGSDGNYIPTGNFGAGDSCIQINAGHKISQNLSLGAGFKYIWETMVDSKMSGVATDMSALFCSANKWTVAGGIENLGPKVEGYPLPGNIHVSYTNSLADSFGFGLEFKSFFDSTMWLKGATEINIDKVCFLRGGYSCPLNNSNSSLGKWYQRNLTLGFGLEIKNFSLDYAWFPFGELGSTNIISLRAKF
jgi:hypothetical protein